MSNFKVCQGENYTSLKIGLTNQEYYQPNTRKIRYGAIRRKYSMPTLENRLKQYRLRTYCKWKQMATINYLSDKEYIDNELNTAEAYITGTQQDLGKLRSIRHRDSQFKYITAIRGKSPSQLTNHIRLVLE